MFFVLSIVRLFRLETESQLININKTSPQSYKTQIKILACGTFAHDVMAAIIVLQNDATADMLVYQANPVGFKLLTYVNTLFSSNKIARLLDG